MNQNQTNKQMIFREEAPTMMLSNKRRELSMIHNPSSKSVVMM